jgi:hypothetical protein
MLAKVREKGPEGVLHGNRNKVSPRRVPEAGRVEGPMRKELLE